MPSADDSTDAPRSDAIADAMAGIPPAALHERMGIRTIEASADRFVLTMPVEGNTQPFGLLHGGASCVLAEGAGSIAAAIWAHPDRMAVGTDISATHHRAVSSGTVTATATPLHRGRTVASYEIAITDETDRRVCTARLTCLLVPARPAPAPAAAAVG